MHPEGMTKHCTKLPTYLTLSSWNCTSICLPESWLTSFSCFSLKALYSNFTADSSLSADCRTMRKSWTSLFNTVKKIQNNLHIILKTVLDIGHTVLQNLLGKSHKPLNIFSGINLKSHTQKGFVNGKGQQNTNFKE